MDLRTAQAAWKLGSLPTDRLPEVAVEALEQGRDSPSLRQLAGLGAGSIENAPGLFQRALEELGHGELTMTGAARYLAREIARGIVSNEIDPYDGARKIWWELYNRFRELGELAIFAGLASEYEDDAAHRDEYARQIIEEARTLLRQQG